MRSTASSVPKASAISCFSIASMVSPYLPRSWSRISGILFSWLLASRNDRPRASPPFAAAPRNAAYFVPASEPLMVPCSIPRMVSCSSRGTFAFVADAPRLSMLEAISEPVVLNCCTDFAIPAENISPNSMSLMSS